MSRRSATAAELHGRNVDWSLPSLTWCEATAPAVVLGSTQPVTVVAPGAAIAVAQRRSGGGAVLVEPGRLLWADVVVPAGDPRWDADVGRAAWWLGEAWVAALSTLGVHGAAVHRGGLVRTPWSALVCFAGLGPGEVTVAGRKVVGISQRRTRQGALFQCAVPLAWEPARLLDVLGLTPSERGEADAALAGAVLALDGRVPADVEAALVAALP